MQDVPDPDGVVRDLLPLVPVTYGALEFGVARARGFFEEPPKQPFEPFLFSQIVRYEARRRLEDLGKVRVDLEMDDLANNGLALMFNDYPLRIRKAFRGGLPTPGSGVLEQFHAQTLGLAGVSDHPNLFILWDLFKPSYMLAPDLYVACPRGTSLRFPNVGECHWLVKLPNVALLPDAPVQVDGFDTYDDLDIRRPIAETGSGEAT